MSRARALCCFSLPSHRSDIMFYAYTYACVISRRISYAHHTRNNTSPSRYTNVFVFESYFAACFCCSFSFLRAVFLVAVVVFVVSLRLHTFLHIYICCFCHCDFNFLPFFLSPRMCIQCSACIYNDKIAAVQDLWCHYCNNVAKITI